jgi:hypothetical protein
MFHFCTAPCLETLHTVTPQIGVMTSPQIAINNQIAEMANGGRLYKLVAPMRATQNDMSSGNIYFA